jgi:CelD/BcsL family acetyltransferase involved in cellulose biosynthesis
LLRKSGTAEQHLEHALSARSRKNLRRKERNLQELGRLERVALRPGDDAGRWIEEFLRLEAAGWKGAGGGALAASESNRRFAFSMLAQAHTRNRLQMVGLNLDGKPLARCCNLLGGEGSYAYRTAYDERFADFSPGIMAEIATIRHFHELPATQWMDSLTEPDNATLNRLWLHRRTMQSVVVGAGSWGEMWVSMLPLLRWTKRRMLMLAPG